MKLSLAEQCGDSARQCRRLSERLVALGVAGYDPRDGGYSKLFAFLRSLQTTGGALVRRIRDRQGAVDGAPGRAAPPSASSKGDDESAQPAGCRHPVARSAATTSMGKQMLIAAVATEESQARARRAAYRTLELAGETAEPLQLRKALGRRR